MLWGLAWYWYAVILGLLIPWVTMYRDLRDNFDDGFMWGLKIYLGVSAVAVSAVLLLSFLLRWYFGKI
jgi:hypothetical protein